VFISAIRVISGKVLPFDSPVIGRSGDPKSKTLKHGGIKDVDAIFGNFGSSANFLIRAHPRKSAVELGFPISAIFGTFGILGNYPIRANPR